MGIARPEVLVIGAGPAGLAAAIEAAEHKASVMVVDENVRAGGQLIKQTHKFFGSELHHAGIRGINIATKLVERAVHLHVSIQLHTPVVAIFEGVVVMAKEEKVLETIRPARLIIATGAIENAICFPGWTLPGVMTAGAAQTFVNIHRVRVGDRVVVVGSGNVGLIIAYQLRQAGSEIVGIVEAKPQIGGWGVHASKIRRMGIPIWLSHTVKEVRGDDRVRTVVIHQIDSNFHPIPGTEKELIADTVCLAVGMRPQVHLVEMAGGSFVYEPVLGGIVPVHNEIMETTVSGVYVAGDVAGVEEASTAIVEGQLAGLAAAYSLGKVSRPAFEERRNAYLQALEELRSGPFGDERKEAKRRIWNHYDQLKQ